MLCSRSVVAGCSAFAALVMILARSTAVYAIASAVHAAPAVAPHHIATARLNPHLHGAAARPVRPVERPSSPDHHEPTHRDPADKFHPREHHEEWEHWRHHWHYRWSYTTWVILHRGLGTVHGTAYNAAGVPTAGIRLALRTPSGQYIHDAGRRHTTYSSGNGAFTMTGVRLGEYRVRAQEGKTAGHSLVSVHPGVMSFVSVKV